MKATTNVIGDFLQTKAEDSALEITKHLQRLSLMIDISMFDPHLKDTSQFYITLYELMSKMEARSPFAWNCVEVLQNACKNPSARRALIDTYQFIPPLSRLLGDHLSCEKKKTLLKLMQNLSCGMRIGWQIPYLPHLIKTLVRWIERQETEIVTLSLGLVVNLCYKNLPAVCVLLANVDVKKLMKTCLLLQGPVVEMYTCKLFVILDGANMSHTHQPKLVEASFKSAIESFRTGELVLLRETVDFFLDANKQCSLSKLIVGKEYERQIETILEILENNDNEMETDSNELRDPQCISIIFEFLYALIEMKLPILINKYQQLIESASNWIQNDLVSYQALRILKSIACSIESNKYDILEPLLTSIPIFLMEIDNLYSENNAIHIEHNRNVCGILQLLRVMLKIDNHQTRISMLENMNKEIIYKIFSPLLQASGGVNEPITDDLNNLYVNALDLVCELVKYEQSWITVQEQLFDNKQIQMVLARALLTGPSSVRNQVMSMCQIALFPVQSVAELMSSCPTSTTQVPHHPTETVFPLFTIAQVEQLDDCLEKMKRSLTENGHSNLVTSDVMELYEFKLTAMSQAERTSMVSLEAATERCTHLQHRLNQSTAEVNRYRHLLLNAEQRFESNVSLFKSAEGELKLLRNQIEAERGKRKVCQMQLDSTQKRVEELTKNLNDKIEKVKELIDANVELSDQYEKLKICICKLEEKGTSLEKSVQKKSDEINSIKSDNEQLNMQIKQQEQILKIKDKELLGKIDELKELNKELYLKKKILDNITRMATSQHE